MLDALLAKLEKEKFGATSRPRARRARQEDGDPRYVSNDVRRKVHARDGEQCTFVSATGERCTERGFLEFDHRTPVALGGKPTVREVRLLCRAHNQYEGERLLGADFMRAKREGAAKDREEAKAAAANAEAAMAKDLTLALRDLGFKAAEVRRAVDATADGPATTIEARVRAALAELTRSRCSDGDCVHEPRVQQFGY